MIILQESTSVQTVSFIPRDTDIDTIIVHDEETNTSQTYSIDNNDIYASSYYYNYDMVFDLKENRFYTITFLNGDVVKYKDKIFCTNQDIATFSVNNNVYVSNTTTNEFIVYE
jgi:hypothetical protein